MRAFNCGIGMVVIVSSEHVEDAQGVFKQNNLQSWVIGSIESSDEPDPYVEFA